MKTKSKVVLGLLACAGLLVPQFAAAQTVPTLGIRDYNMPFYIQAQQTLEAELPSFSKDFSKLAKEISKLEDTDEVGQYKALMQFFPAIEAMLDIKPSISTQVAVSYFAIGLYTANGTVTNVGSLLFNAFEVYEESGDAVCILSEEELMAKYSMSREEAQHIRNVLHKLYPTNTLL